MSTGLKQSISQQNCSVENNEKVLNPALYFNVTTKYPVLKKNDKPDENIF